MISTFGTHWKKQQNNKELSLLMQILTGKIAIKSLYLILKNAPNLILYFPASVSLY